MNIAVYNNSFIIIMTVYGRFFKLYMYTAIAPIPLSTFAGQPTQNIGKSFLKSYAAVCLEGAIIVLACIIFSLFASSPPVVDADAAPAAMVWIKSTFMIPKVLLFGNTNCYYSLLADESPETESFVMEPYHLMIWYFFESISFV